MTTEKAILHKNGLEQISKIRRNNKHKLRKEHQKESLKCILNVDTKTNLFAALSFLWFVFKYKFLFLPLASSSPSLSLSRPSFGAFFVPLLSLRSLCAVRLVLLLLLVRIRP
jgi:membrane-associated phospholipid phosphatase